MKHFTTLAGLGALGVSLTASAMAFAAAKSEVPTSTPAGVTLVDVLNPSEQFLWRRLGDAEGKPLYTFDADGTTGKVTCLDACAKEFPAYYASANAVAQGEWTLIARDGQKQWAYQGRPLYTYSGKDPGDRPAGRRGAKGGKLGEEVYMDPSSSVYSPKEGWRRAAFIPEDIKMPSGITMKSLATANGYGFVLPSTGMVMYTLKTAPKNATSWTPVYAPGAAAPIGDFSIMTREDGKRQWAYKGDRLYTFNDDYSSGDINGLVAQKDAQVALAYKHFQPANLKVDVLALRGPIMVNDKGLSVYIQSRFHTQYGGRETRGGFRYTYADAKGVGGRGCVAACLKTWQPVAAPANAQASGFWEPIARADGTKQWSYKGGALYTYVADKKPGDIGGNNRHDILYGDKEGTVDLSVTGGNSTDGRDNAGSGFYWHLVGFFN